jgi:hypothetical protein
MRFESARPLILWDKRISLGYRCQLANKSSSHASVSRRDGGVPDAPVDWMGFESDPAAHSLG